MNWSTRYASGKIPSHCIFCKGSSHFLKNAKDWTEENSAQIGLPRPSVATDPLLAPNAEDAQDNWRKRVIIPWSTKPLGIKTITDEGSAITEQVTPESGNRLNAAPAPIPEREEQVRTHSKCAMCGDQFKPNDLTVRFQGYHGTVESDHYPMHPECMRQTVSFCPHMMGYKDDFSKLQSGKSKFFSRGAYSDLFKKSVEQTKIRTRLG